MTTLSPRAGFDWTLVQWGGPKQRRTTRCSYCAAPLGEGEVPLIFWKEDGSAAEFCVGCQKRWFGLETFDEPEERTCH